MLNRVRALARPVKGRSQICPRATPALSWLCAQGHPPAGEPAPRSEVSRALEQVFLKDLSVLHSNNLSFLFRLVSQFLSLKHIPTARCCHRHASPQGWYYPGDKLYLPYTRCDAWHSGQRLSFGFIRPPNRVSHGLRVLQYSKQAVIHILLRNGFHLATPP